MKPAAQRYEGAPHAHAHARPQYQLEMGTKSILTMFFALAVVCGLFFAFGYTIGKHAVPASFRLGGAAPLPARTSRTPDVAPGVQAPNPQGLSAAETNSTPEALTPSTDANAAGNPGAEPAAATGAAGAAAGIQPPASGNTAASASAHSPAATPAPNAAATHNIAPPGGASTAAGILALPSPKATPASATTGTDAGAQLFEVQVFAGTAGDAGSLASALKTRGYPAQVVTPAAGGASQLYRVEVGPYLTRAEAEAMRSRLRADGYQAVVRN